MGDNREQRRNPQRDEPVGAALDRCRPWLQAALDRSNGTHEWQDVLALLEAGKAQFWPGNEAAMVTEILRHPRKSVMHIWLAGGDMAELLRMVPDVEIFGKMNGCEAIALDGRTGWQRVLKDWGVGGVSMFKEIAQ